MSDYRVAENVLNWISANRSGFTGGGVGEQNKDMKISNTARPLPLPPPPPTPSPSVETTRLIWLPASPVSWQTFCEASRESTSYRSLKGMPFSSGGAASSPEQLASLGRYSGKCCRDGEASGVTSRDPAWPCPPSGAASPPPHLQKDGGRGRQRLPIPTLARALLLLVRTQSAGLASPVSAAG